MTTIRRGLRAAAFALCLAALGGAGALAQEAQKAETVGPPALKDFQLPGQRTTPPAQTPPPPARTEPAPAEPAPARTQPRAEPVRPAETRPSAPAPARTRPEPAAQPQVTVPAPAAPVEPTVAEPSEPVAVPPAPVTTAPVPDATPAEAEAGNGWLWPLMALVVAGIAIFAFLRLSGRNAPARRPATATPRAAALPAPPPPPPAPAPPAGPRAWIELSIKADRAAATAERAVIAYELLLDNVGEAAARNIRIEPKLFNAGAEREVSAFFKAAMRDQSGSPHVTIEPGKGIRLNGEVALPMAEVRAVEMQGRQLFIPLVAICVAYDWEGGSGRTSKSWLVGREAETPAAKMGAFRLDLGPRIYRSVGQREAQLVKV